ncbi:NUDIX hydrolase [Carbonactinospora thermoautotrophica]|uniref:NUDIX hydrolase n=2 Tax=Carbonactinospora thermoautotrophica TaxID=1469144 RepID=A0A132MLX6_9ACTN|nr:NUDIX domain-containing protein [Carbonactinospora thermoautotrophica]KWW97517.1 NUDIX hydrolase [Carbonactinospora thermoautotrophica]KWW98828.1 putative DNA hydrolase [Carbonactinospora thermoautotrophica]
MKYDPREYPPFAVAVDLAVFTIRQGVCAVLLVERGVDPYAGCWALPGGFVRADESAEDAATRELAEETGLAPFPGHLEQLRTYSTPNRDPRMRVVSVAYVAFAPDLPTPRPGGDVVRARWWAVDELAPSTERPRLAFDHDRIVADAFERVAAKLEYTPLATAFCPAEFTLGELQAVYEAVWGVSLDRPNFRRKVLATPGFVERVEGAAPQVRGRGAPAALYRAGKATALHPPLLRPEGARSFRVG